MAALVDHFWRGEGRRCLTAGLLAVGMVLSGCGKKSETPAADNRAVNFTAQDLQGRPVSLSQFRGKIVLLNIWATWCKPCLHEIPDLKTLYDEQKANNVVVLGVLLESGSVEEARAVVENQLKITYPVWMGDDAFARQFDVQAFPTTVVMDREGRAVKTMIGMQTKARFADALKEAGL